MLIAILTIAGLGIVFGLVTYFNNKTPVPEGCEEVEAGCSACNISSCNLHPSHKEA